MEIITLIKRFLFVAIFFSLPGAVIAIATNSYSQSDLKKAEIIYNKMSLDERIGQLLLPTYRLLATSVQQPVGKKPGYLCQQAVTSLPYSEENVVKNCGLNQIAKYHIGAVLQDGGPYYNSPTAQNWLTLNNLAKKIHSQSLHDPLLLIGNDSIHGNNHVMGAVIFPHNINLGVTHDDELVRKIGKLTAYEALMLGFNWSYMPTVAVAHDLRWGRTYESFGQEPTLVKMLAHAYISGYQQIENGTITGVLASVKHFIGDGATLYGLDEGDVKFSGSQEQFWAENGLGYEGALDAGALNFMVSYNAINGKRMHFGGEWNILSQFKNADVIGSDNKRYHFKGFSVSDYNGPTRAAYFADQSNLSLPEIFAKSINSGVDMIMLGTGDTRNPFDPQSPFYYTSIGQAAQALKTAYKNNLISEQRLKDAVIRILTAKIAMASRVHETSYSELQKSQQEVALQAAEESLVLLKNENQILPLKKSQIKNIIFLGETNDLGVQNGGWTVNWQGQKGDEYFTGKDKFSSGANTVEESLHNIFGLQAKIFHRSNVPTHLQNWSEVDTVAIVAVAEPPYAEYMGDIGNAFISDKWYEKGIASEENIYMPKKQAQTLRLQFSKKDAEIIQMLHAKGIPVITIVFSGRPIILSEGNLQAPLQNSNAVIAAFLPGTLGGDALANAILGRYHFKNNGRSNRLTFPWPRDMKDISDHFANGSLYAVGYGLMA